MTDDAGHCCRPGCLVDHEPAMVAYTVTLPPKLDEWLAGEADRTGVTPAEVLHRLVEQAAADQ